MSQFKFKSAEDFDPKVMGRALCMKFDAVVSSFAQNPEERVNGALSSYIYDIPQYPGDLVDGGIHYSRYVRLPTSLIPQKQPKLLKEFAEEIEPIIGPGASFFDLGPGPEWSVKSNTIPALKALKPSKYFAVDIELHFTDDACKTVDQELPQVSTQGVAVDFHFQTLPASESSVSLVWYPGSTLGNLPSKPDQNFSENQFVIDHLSQLRLSQSSSAETQEQRYLVLLMDAQKDNLGSMVDLYISPEAKGCFISILHKLKRDLKAESFDPSLLEYSPRWNSHSSVVEHQFTAIGSQTFSITDCFSGRQATIEIEEGEIYTLANSMKPAAEDVRTALSRSGWETLKSSTDAEKQFHIHLARAVY